MLTREQRLRRSVLLGAFVGALVWGTAWGNDVHFPFGPFRMYSTSTRGHINVMEFHAVTAAGEEIELSPSAFGLRRAEFDGQRDRLIAQPELLDKVVDSYETARPDGPELVELHLVHVVYRLIEGRPVIGETEVLASWARD